jgi:hypothetical protein
MRHRSIILKAAILSASVLGGCGAPPGEDVGSREGEVLGCAGGGTMTGMSSATFYSVVLDHLAPHPISSADDCASYAYSTYQYTADGAQLIYQAKQQAIAQCTSQEQSKANGKCPSGCSEVMSISCPVLSGNANGGYGNVGGSWSQYGFVDGQPLYHCYMVVTALTQGTGSFQCGPPPS